MHLIYVNEIGSDYKGQKQYELIFSNSTELDIDSWFDIPASISTQTKSPDVEYVDMVGLLKDTNLQLELIQNSDYFGVIDAVEGIIALAWEKYDSDSDIDRIYFKFGESLESVLKKINQRNYELIQQEINN